VAAGPILRSAIARLAGAAQQRGAAPGPLRRAGTGHGKPSSVNCAAAWRRLSRNERIRRSPRSICIRGSDRRGKARRCPHKARRAAADFSPGATKPTIWPSEPPQQPRVEPPAAHSGFVDASQVSRECRLRTFSESSSAWGPCQDARAPPQRFEPDCGWRGAIPGARIPLDAATS